MNAYNEENEYDDLNGAESRESRSTDPDENTGLVRKASLGRQYKPSLTTVRSSSSSSLELLSINDKMPKQIGAAGVIAAAAGGALGVGP